MRTALTVALSLCLAAAASPSLAASPPVTMMRDAREQVPAALLGVWKVEPAAGAASAPLQLRSFQYTEAGRLLVNFITLRTDGRQSYGHWSLQVDGSPGYEYRSDNYSTPIAEIRFKKLDERTFELTNSVMGHVDAKAVWKLSEDGQTLTADRTATSGAKSVTVYRRFSGL